MLVFVSTAGDEGNGIIALMRFDFFLFFFSIILLYVETDTSLDDCSRSLLRVARVIRFKDVWPFQSRIVSFSTIVWAKNNSGKSLVSKRRL